MDTQINNEPVVNDIGHDESLAAISQTLAKHSQCFKFQFTAARKMEQQVAALLAKTNSLEELLLSIGDNSQEPETHSHATELPYHPPLISLLDSVFHQMNSLADTFAFLLELVPKKTGLFFKKTPLWRQQFEASIASYLEGLDLVRNKIDLKLAELDIVLIAPVRGEPFSPSLHKAVERIPGASAQTIAHTLRCGYHFQNQIIRHAEVAIYIG